MTIMRSCEECPYRGIDGGPGPVMTCNHPAAEDYGYIISWVDGERQSDRCPKETSRLT